MSSCAPGTGVSSHTHTPPHQAQVSPLTHILLHTSLVPRPTPSFSSFAVQKTVLQAMESWEGPGNELGYLHTTHPHTRTASHVHTCLTHTHTHTLPHTHTHTHTHTQTFSLVPRRSVIGEKSSSPQSPSAWERG